jgi:beta propeller repeat protein
MQTKNRRRAMPATFLATTMKNKLTRIGLWAMSLLLVGALQLRAQQQQTGVCAGVKIVILQQLTIERIGFEATLEITNNDGDDPITDFSADLTFENQALSTDASVNDSAPLFFVRAPTFENIDNVTGTGSIGPTKKAVVRWFIIPKISAGGTSPDGVRYRVGAILSGKIRGKAIPDDTLKVYPASIPVKPEPQLEITYFQPRDVQGDDPFTPEVESPIPFTIGVLIKNSGYGIAKKMKIASQQPQIVENKTSLLLIAQLLGSRLNDSALADGNLTINFGDLNPGQTIKGAWDMITSLSGEFVDFKASYTHSSDLGGEETSVIKSLNAYLIAHEVLNDQPGRDNIKDFLADTDKDLIPDALYESEGNVLPVNYLQNTEITGSGFTYTVKLIADKGSWAFFRVADPAQAHLPIQSVVRSDGKVLNANNVWTNIRFQKGTNQRDNWLNFMDLVNVGTYTYTVTYAPVSQDTTPPVTTLHFAGASTETAGKFYITPDTQMYFISEDASPVSIYYSVTNGPFLPALPFRLQNPGEYPMRFYASDTFGNIEHTNTATLVVSGVASLDFASVTAPTDPISIAGDASSIRPGSAKITFAAQTNPTALNAQLDIFQGVAGWVTVANVPSSTTRSTSASLVIGGDNVDYYRYRQNLSTWSSEQPVSVPVTLTGLGGPQRVDVIGRSQYGSYLPDTNAVTVNWFVDTAGPTTTVAGPATPTRSNSANLTVAGSGVTAYRYTINNGFYRPESNLLDHIVVSALNPGPQVVSVIGKTNGVYQPTNVATTVTWTYDPAYGSDLSALRRVRSASFANVGSNPVTFTWDGRNDSNVIVTPGWYTVRITLSDPLGHQVFSTKLVKLDEVSGALTELADVTRGAKNPHARRGRAVWQDQSSGGFNIYARSLAGSDLTVKPVTTSPVSQENPKTDGRYVVWQARQPNGNWDIYLKDLDSSAAAVAVTQTSTFDEINPVIEWPWIVYQRRNTGDPAAVSRLIAQNLVTAATFAVSPATQDQLDPDIQGGRVVWQDFRDVGPGEIYFRNLDSLDPARRITTNSWGQYHPAIFDNVIVWQDNRAGQVDLFAFDLWRNTEIQLTSTPENETRPFIDGEWVVAEEDSLGANVQNIRLVHIPSQKVVPLTRSLTFKSRPSLSGGAIVWQDDLAGKSRIMSSEMPSVQGVFDNRNVVAVTPAMAAYQHDAYTLLNLWKQQGVEEITQYKSFVPQVTSDTAFLLGNTPSGPNFQLVPGTFLWVKFPGVQVLDLGVNPAAPLNLSAGVNVLTYTHFPSDYSAYRLMQKIGLGNVRAVRMLDSEGGNWVVAEVRNGAIVGNDFRIPQVAVVMLDLTNAVSQFKPE